MDNDSQTVVMGPQGRSVTPFADGSTPNYSFTLPQVGASDNTWGSKLNDNWSALDSYLNEIANSFLELGEADDGTNTVQELYNTLVSYTRFEAKGEFIVTYEGSFNPRFQSSASNLNVVVNSPINTTNGVQFQKSGFARWFIGSTDEQETGSNDGAPFRLIAYSDGGNVSTNVMSAERNTQIVRFFAAPKCDDAPTQGNDLVNKVYVDDNFRSNMLLAEEKDLRAAQFPYNPAYIFHELDILQDVEGYLQPNKSQLEAWLPRAVTDTGAMNTDQVLVLVMAFCKMVDQQLIDITEALGEAINKIDDLEERLSQLERPGHGKP